MCLWFNFCFYYFTCFTALKTRSILWSGVSYILKNTVYMYDIPKQKQLFKSYFMCLGILSVCMSVPYLHSWCLSKSERTLGPLELDL